MYAELNRNALRWRLNVVVDDRMSFSSVGKRFQTQGAARERMVSESLLRPWKKEVTAAGDAQRRACWYVSDRCEQVANVVDLRLWSVEKTRNGSFYLIKVFKIVNGMSATPWSHFSAKLRNLQPDTAKNWWRIVAVVTHVCTSCLNESSTDGTQEDIDATSVNSFKNQLERRRTHQTDFFKDT